MTKKVLFAALFVILAFALVWAGTPSKGTTGNAQMEQMKAAMMKCDVCKNLAAHMDEIGPMGTEAVQLNDGLAMRHWVMSTDQKKIATFHTACQAMSKAGEATMAYTDDQAKTNLCDMCQSIRSAMKSGAHMSQGETANGNIMVLTSSDAAVQTQLTDLQKKCAMMASSMGTPAKTSSTTEKK